MHKNRRGEEMTEEKRCQQKFESWKLHELMLTVIAYWSWQKSLQRGQGPVHIGCRTTERLYAGAGATKKP